MRAIEFKEQNKIYAKGQPEYKQLPAHCKISGEVISCWELSDEEFEHLKETRKIYISQLTFNEPLQPVTAYAQNPCYMYIPFRQSIVEGLNAYTSALGCLLNVNPRLAPNVEQMMESEGASVAIKSLDNWLLRFGFKRERFSSEPSDEYLYLSVGEKEGRTNSVIMSLGNQVHDTSPDEIGIDRIYFHEVIRPIRVVDSTLN